MKQLQNTQLSTNQFMELLNHAYNNNTSAMDLGINIISDRGLSRAWGDQSVLAGFSLKIIKTSRNGIDCKVYRLEKI